MYREIKLRGVDFGFMVGLLVFVLVLIFVF
jgi:hypothetical protein